MLFSLVLGGFWLCLWDFCVVSLMLRVSIDTTLGTGYSLGLSSEIWALGETPLGVFHLPGFRSGIVFRDESWEMRVFGFLKKMYIHMKGISDVLWCWNFMEIMGGISCHTTHFAKSKGGFWCVAKWVYSSALPWPTPHPTSEGGEACPSCWKSECKGSLDGLVQNMNFKT